MRLNITISDLLAFSTKLEVVLAARWRLRTDVTSPIDSLISVSNWSVMYSLDLTLSVSTLLTFSFAAPILAEKSLWEGISHF